MSSYNCFVYGPFISVSSKMAASEKAFADSIRFLGTRLPTAQRIIAVYTKAKMLSFGYQLVSVSQYATRCCHLRA